MNQKYYEDIKKFPSQFSLGFEWIKSVDVKGDFNRVVICGVGGSSLYTEFINDYLATFSGFRLDLARGYEIPSFSDSKTLFVVASHSGNTEETISCFEEILKKGYSYVTFTSGGKLEAMTNEHNGLMFKMPGGIQPRLSTGYFVAGVIGLLIKLNLISNVEAEVLAASAQMDGSLNEDLAKQVASRIKSKVPVVYATNNFASVARVTKIKFNENTKTQSFWNEFPELNHNEMVGFTNLVMNPFFLMFESKFTNPRNAKRIQVFSKLMKEKNVDLEVIKPAGRNLFEEMLNCYYLADHITYHLAAEYGIDPEPVAMVEDFKKLMVS